MSTAKINQYGFIDAMRGIAILSVIVSHAFRNVVVHGAMGAPQTLPVWMHDFLVPTGHGVQLFFLVSALTLCLSARGRASETNSRLNFFIRRVFRIAPMFYFAFVLYALLPALRGKLNIEWGESLATVLFINGWNPSWISSPLVPGGWSIAVEMMFYLIFPVLFLGVTTLRRAVVALVISLGLALIANALLLFNATSETANQMTWFAYAWLPTQLPVFLMGFLLYFLLFGPTASRIETFLSERRNLFILTAICAASFAIAPYVSMPPVQACWVYGVMFMMLVTLSKVAYRGALSNPFLQFTGKLSFSAYLLHFFILRVTANLLNLANANALPAPVYLLALSVLSISGTLAISYLSYKYVEVPGQALGKRLINRLDRPSAASTLTSH